MAYDINLLLLAAFSYMGMSSSGACCGYPRGAATDTLCDQRSAQDARTRATGERAAYDHAEKRLCHGPGFRAIWSRPRRTPRVRQATPTRLTQPTLRLADPTSSLLAQAVAQSRNYRAVGSPRIMRLP